MPHRNAHLNLIDSSRQLFELHPEAEPGAPPVSVRPIEIAPSAAAEAVSAAGASRRAAAERVGGGPGQEMTTGARGVAGIEGGGPKGGAGGGGWGGAKPKTAVNAG